MNVQIVGLIALSLTLAINSTLADEVGVAPPPDLTDLVKRRLPPNWTCRTEGTSLVVRPEKAFVFVNLINADGGRRGETKDEYHRRHIVKIDYRIVLRFVSKFSRDDLRNLVASNNAIRAKLRAVEQNPLATRTRGKGQFSFAKTPQERALSRQYWELKESLQPVPYGHRGSVSVYVEPTHLGYARFLQK